jgi:hypothetical protein
VSLKSSCLSAAAAEETTLQSFVDAVSGKKQRQLLQSECKGSVAERMVSPRACQCPNQLQLNLFSNRRNLAMARTTVSKAAVSSRLRLLPAQPPLHPTQEDRPSGRLPQWAVNVSLFFLRCWRWNPSHPVPNRLIQYPLPHRISLHCLLPPNRGSSSANCPQNRNPVHSRV